jgi:hypothetical protein
MDKGVSGVQNVRTLRDATAAGLTVSWNWLYGFPGETFAAYQPVLDQLPALIHLPAPQAVTRISLERFSPHFDNPALGFAEKKPSRVYDHVYRLPADGLQDLAYVFEAPARGLDSEQSRELRDVVERWRDHHPGSTLHRIDDGETITVIDRRHGRPEKDHRFSGPLWRAAYLDLEHGRTPDALARRIAEQGIECDRVRLDDWLDGLREQGLVFEESGRCITLATSTEPIELAVG